MEKDPHHQRPPSSDILPMVIAAFVGATLVVACERPDARVAGADARVAANDAPARPQAEPQGNAAAPAAPVAPPPDAVPSPMPAPEALEDTAITARTRAAIETDPRLDGADLTVNTDRGVVSLSGRVESHEQAAIAAAHAQKQDGVMLVESHVSVEHRR